MKVYDLIVIGAGLAGAFAAQLACKSGLSTLILDKGRALKDRRDPACGWFGQGLHRISRLKDDSSPAAAEVLELCRDANGGKIETRQCDEIEIVVDGRRFLPIKWHEFRPSVGRELATRMLHSLSASTDLLFETDVKKVTKTDEGFLIQANRGRFATKQCLVAVGGKSVEWTTQVAKSLNLDVVNPPVRFGLRVELPVKIMKSFLSEHGRMFQIEHAGVLSEDVWPNGFVGEWEDFNLVSAFGHQPSGKRSERTNFMLSIDVTEGFEEALRLVRIINVLSNDKLKSERAYDLVQGRSVLQHFTQFNKLVKGLLDWRHMVPRFIESATVHIPELHIGGSLSADENMRTTCSNFYVAGQCVSQVNTLLGAMASGLIAAHSIIEDKESL